VPNLAVTGRTVAEIWAFFDLQYGGQERQTASSSQDSWRSVKPLLRYGTIQFNFSKMAAVRHLGFMMRVFRPPTKGIWWSLSLMVYHQSFGCN